MTSHLPARSCIPARKRLRQAILGIGHPGAVGEEWAGSFSGSLYTVGIHVLSPTQAAAPPLPGVVRPARHRGSASGFLQTVFPPRSNRRRIIEGTADNTTADQNAGRVTGGWLVPVQEDARPGRSRSSDVEGVSRPNREHSSLGGLVFIGSTL